MAYTGSRVAVCTTIYPGVERYLQAWYASVLQQSDKNYTLWIALDGLTPDEVSDAIGQQPDATWVHAAAGESPAAIRQRLFAAIVERCDVVVMIDSDDLMHADRVAAARAALIDCDMVGCALRLVDQQARPLGRVFTLADPTSVCDVLPRYNVFGLSNTAWRCTLLRDCMPIPADIEIVDWFIASRAWLQGARLGFDPQVHMDYRQHPSNMVRVSAPFCRDQLLRDTHRARQHFRRLCASAPTNSLADRITQLTEVAADIECFATWVEQHPDQLDSYIASLNALDPAPLWWSSVAHPSLRPLWSIK
jgi:hypothetical protein